MENMWKNGVYMEGWSSTKPLRRIPAQGWLIPLSEFLGKDPAPDLKNQILSPHGKQMLLPLRSKTENNPLQMESFSQHFAFGRSSSTAEIFQFPDSSASSGGEVHRNSTQTQIFFKRRHSQLIIHYDLAQKNGMYR